MGRRLAAGYARREALLLGRVGGARHGHKPVPGSARRLHAHGEVIVGAHSRTRDRRRVVIDRQARRRRQPGVAHLRLEPLQRHQGWQRRRGWMRDQNRPPWRRRWWGGPWGGHVRSQKECAMQRHPQGSGCAKKKRCDVRGAARPSSPPLERFLAKGHDANALPSASSKDCFSLLCRRFSTRVAVTFTHIYVIPTPCGVTAYLDPPHRRRRPPRPAATAHGHLARILLPSPTSPAHAQQRQTNERETNNTIPSTAVRSSTCRSMHGVAHRAPLDGCFRCR